ncbi:MAG: hypothetical protein K2R98_24250 [Gemmataceae bacterium]|nr:hypothetical protein [Gemmataceae bacterium]
MSSRFERRLGLVAVMALVVSPFLFVAADTPKPAVKSTFFNGKVVPLSDVLAKSGLKLDKDAAPFWLTLVTDDGKVYPLIKDEGSRMFYGEPKLQNRPMRISARLFGDTQLLQVLQVQSVIEGKLHEVYYWCDICTIKRHEKKDCECCGAPMELREEPVKK